MRLECFFRSILFSSLLFPSRATCQRWIAFVSFLVSSSLLLHYPILINAKLLDGFMIANMSPYTRHKFIRLIPHCSVRTLNLNHMPWQECKKKTFNLFLYLSPRFFVLFLSKWGSIKACSTRSGFWLKSIWKCRRKDKSIESFLKDCCCCGCCCLLQFDPVHPPGIYLSKRL